MTSKDVSVPRPPAQGMAYRPGRAIMKLMKLVASGTGGLLEMEALNYVVGGLAMSVIDNAMSYAAFCTVLTFINYKMLTLIGKVYTVSILSTGNWSEAHVTLKRPAEPRDVPKPDRKTLH